MSVKKIINKVSISAVIFIIILVVSSVLIIISNLSTVAREPPEGSIEVPIIMYHGLLKDRRLQNKYVISPDLFKSDLITLKENGYKTIFIEELISYVYDNVELPEKPIIITFDDGYYNNYLYAFPLLKEYDSKIVFSPIGECVDKYSGTLDIHPSYAHATWSNIKEMVDSGLIEVANHSYNMHKNGGSRIGSKRKQGEDVCMYKNILSADLSKMQDKVFENIGMKPKAFTYPFGAVSDQSLDAIKELGFKAALICQNKTNNITKDPECLYHLCRFLRPNDVSSKSFFKQVVKLDIK